MRCGVETSGRQVFCTDCLASMERYPIKPGTPIHLPERQQAAEPRRPVRKKRELTAEEQLPRLQRLVQLLAAGLAAALILAGIFGGLLFVELTDEEPQHPGARNYSTTELR
jgi:hypothetical protein